MSKKAALQAVVDRHIKKILDNAIESVSPAAELRSLQAKALSIHSQLDNQKIQLNNQKKELEDLKKEIASKIPDGWVTRNWNQIERDFVKSIRDKVEA